MTQTVVVIIGGKEPNTTELSDALGNDTDVKPGIPWRGAGTVLIFDGTADADTILAVLGAFGAYGKIRKKT